MRIYFVGEENVSTQSSTTDNSYKDFTTTFFQQTGTRGIFLFDGLSSWQPDVIDDLAEQPDVPEMDEGIRNDQPGTRFFVVDGELRRGIDESPPGLQTTSRDSRLLGIR